ncbi:MAG: hypothetical protein E7536_02225 [Ruminococcaceae bacterium]|nr:hypothetical protein [Oscillospiraceae bacterium]
MHKLLLRCVRMINRKKLVFSSSILLGLFFVLSILRITDTARLASSNAVVNKFPEIKVIIDAGHGGVDGGAVASDSTLEKDINLDIALKLNELLKMSGAETIMTRESDISIHDESAKTIRAKKSSDIHNRFNILKSNPDYIFVSIHQNTYSQSQYKGAQLFYSPDNAGSIDLARCIQTSISERLQKYNEREIKKCSTDVFLIYHAQSVAVLCECGFLSNPDELDSLKNDEYRKEIAFCIFSGILDYYSSLK